jgi:hypothetical protein
VEVLEGRSLPSVLVVTNAHDSGKGSLRDQIAAAQDGDTIKFSAGLTGKTITLTSGEIAIDIGLDIEGPGASKLAISGNNASRIFEIGQDSSAVTIAGLMLKNGLSREGFGGAVVDDGASLTLKSDFLINNEATFNLPFGAEGGALGVLANFTTSMTVTVSDCRFADDTVIGGVGGPGQSGGENVGGAMYVGAGSSAGLALTVTGTTFTGDSATGGRGGDGIAIGPTAGGDGGLAQGGAVFIDAGFAARPSFDFSNDTFSFCSATGGTAGNGVSGDKGGNGGEADGAALSYTADFASAPTLSVATCTFTSNTASGGDAGAGGDAVATADTLASGGAGGFGGAGQGGAVYADFQDSAAGSESFTADSFQQNSASGGFGGAGGFGFKGGAGGSGGSAAGGGLSINLSDLAADTQLTIAQSAIINNTAQAGGGGTGGAGANGGHGGASASALGGGLFLFADIFASWTLSGNSIARNAANSGNGGSGGFGIDSGGNGGGAISSFGGGVFDEVSNLEVLSSTIIYNSVGDGQGGSGGSGLLPGSAGISGPGFGGGLVVFFGKACADNTVIANNSADIFPDVNVILVPC